LITATRRAVSEVGANIPPAELNSINSILTTAEQALSSDDMNTITLAMLKVEEVAGKVTESMLSAV
jgi:hypothetical protein